MGDGAGGVAATSKTSPPTPWTHTGDARIVCRVEADVLGSEVRVLGLLPGALDADHAVEVERVEADVRAQEDRVVAGRGREGVQVDTAVR